MVEEPRMSIHADMEETRSNIRMGAWDWEIRRLGIITTAFIVAPTLIHFHPQSSITTTASVSSPGRSPLSQRAAEKRPARELDSATATSHVPHDLFLPPKPPPSPPQALPLFDFELPQPHRPVQRRSLLNTLFSRSSPTPAPRPPPERIRQLRSGPSHLWNPVNAIPRPTPVHITKPPPAVLSAGPEKTTLLTLPEQRRSRASSPGSPIVEHNPTAADNGTGSNRSSIALPRSQHRTSFQGSTRASEPPSPAAPGPSKSAEMAAATEKPLPAEPDYLGRISSTTDDKDIESGLAHGRNRSLGGTTSRFTQAYGASIEDTPARPPRHTRSQSSLRSHRSRSSLPGVYNTSQRPMTSDSQNPGASTAPSVADELSWGPSHPCFPHLNPHVPLNSPEYETTRIIRIRRDWMVRGDLAPTFSNLYPEILDPLIPEDQFRIIISKINSVLTASFDPFSTRNWLDSIIGLATGWLWEDLGATGVKKQLTDLEAWLEKWNQEVGIREDVKIIPLRRTGYMTLDLQIPDPQVRVIGDGEGEGDAASAAAELK